MNIVDTSRPIRVIHLDTKEEKIFESIKKAGVYYFGGTRNGQSYLQHLVRGSMKTCETKYGKITARYLAEPH